MTLVPAGAGVFCFEKDDLKLAVYIQLWRLELVTTKSTKNTKSFHKATKRPHNVYGGSRLWGWTEATGCGR